MGGDLPTFTKRDDALRLSEKQEINITYTKYG
jgi:hypothetical protein